MNSFMLLTCSYVRIASKNVNTPFPKEWYMLLSALNYRIEHLYRHERIPHFMTCIYLRRNKYHIYLNWCSPRYKELFCFTKFIVKEIMYCHLCLIHRCLQIHGWYPAKYKTCSAKSPQIKTHHKTGKFTF